MRPHLDHLEEQAELYALGLLADGDAERADAHIRTCRDCAERVGRAETAVAAIVDATQPRAAAPLAMRMHRPQAADAATVSSRTQRPWRLVSAWTSAAAAGFALATGALVAQTATLRSSIAADGTVFAAMIHSHFSHTQFVSLAGTPIDAKVVYERHGGWYEILATGIDDGTRVAIVRAGAVSLAPQRFVRRGTVMTLALPALGAVGELRLLDAQGRLVARVRPSLAAPAH